MGWRHAYGLPHPIRTRAKEAEMKTKSKAEALRILHNSAIAYKTNLLNKNVMFIASKEAQTLVFEAKFLPSNFKHLTGIITSLNSTRFYEAALSNKLNESNIDFARDGTTQKKLDILFSLMSIHKTAKMAGDFESAHKVLISDKVAGTTTAVMGFVKDDYYFVPNTVIKDDVRQVASKPTLPVIAIFTKIDKNSKYSELSYLRKDATIENILTIIPRIKEKLANELLTEGVGKVLHDFYT